MARTIWHRIRRLRISNKIILFNTLIVILSMIGFVIAGNYLIRDLSIDKAKKQTDRDVMLVSNSLDLAVNTMVEHTINISIDDRLVEYLDAYDKGELSIYGLNRILTLVVNENLGVTSLVTGCEIITKSGDVINISPYVKDEMAHVINEIYADNALDDVGVAWYGPETVRHNNGLESTVMILKKNIVGIYNPNYLGTMFMYVDTKVFQEIYETSLVFEDNRYFVLDGDGKVITSNAAHSQGLYFQTIGKSLMDPENYHSVENPLSADGWRLVVGVPLSRYYSTYNRYLLFLIMIVLAQFLMSMLLSLFMARSVSRPVQGLVETMGKIRRGDRSVRASIHADSSDEMMLLQTTFNRLMDANDQLIDEVFETQKNIRKYEMLLLQEQIKPHFLYNALGTVSSFVKLGMTKEAMDAINSLARFFRLSLSEGNEIITLKQEIELVKSYLIIQRYRYVEVMDFEIFMDASMEEERVPKILLQPIVENAIYHGIKPKETMEKSAITVTVKRDGDNLVFGVYDNGVGMTPEVLEALIKSVNNPDSGTNFGLRSVNQRIKLMYGEAFGVDIESEAGKFTLVTITIPANQS